ncbi:hypothetical protein CSC3H3_03460 [Thalassospira marina]|uniref:Uncharacterized protein n=1 Tax=Thalassospira marina TaxID=2048283 RepID=A0ABN5FAX3_9PROT|nr:hypothetical protein CSC3H3_03460 [Thalassospira marina]
MGRRGSPFWDRLEFDMQARVYRLAVLAGLARHFRAVAYRNIYPRIPQPGDAKLAHIQRFPACGNFAQGLPAYANASDVPIVP